MFLQFKDNYNEESDYVGWAIRPEDTSPTDVIAYLSGWKNMYESTKRKRDLLLKQKVTEFIIVESKNCGYRSDSPTICAMMKDKLNKNQTLSEVSSIFSDLIEIQW